MQQAKAITKYQRISPRKARLVADMVRGKRVEEAAAILQFSNKKAGRMIGKTLKSAVANAENNLGLNRSNLVVSTIFVDEGPTMKRAKSKCRGGRSPVLKRMSHFTVVVEAKG